MDIVRLLSQIDLSKLDKEWTIAPQKEYDRMRKRSNHNAMYFRVLLVIGVGSTALLFLLSLWMVISYKEDVWLTVVCFMLFIFGLFFFPRRCMGFAELYNKNNGLIVEKKNVFFIYEIKGRYGTVVCCGEYTENNEVIIRQIPYNSMSLKRNFRVGDILTLVRTNNCMMDIDKKVNYGNVMESKNNCSESFHKIEEYKIYKGNDHRNIEFYMKRTDSSIRFLAVKQRLDISDDRVIQTLNEYCVEEFSIVEAANPKLFTSFRQRIIEDVERACCGGTGDCAQVIV